MSEAARVHYDRGLALYGDKDYAGAIGELEAGYALDPRREFLFAEAQALRLSGDCKGAVPLYKRFLDSEPDDVQINGAHIALARCAEQMASTPAATATSTTSATPPLQVTTTPVAPTPPRAPAASWYRDAAGGVLLGAGVAALAFGTAFTFAALSARDDANQSAQSYADYSRRWTTAHDRWQIGLAGFATGAALTAAALYRYLHVRRERGPTGATRALDAWAGPAATTSTTGGGIAASAVAGVGGRF
jgi:hypothetical protein